LSDLKERASLVSMRLYGLGEKDAGGVVAECREELGRLRGALIQLRLDICHNATDTVWVGSGETAVDRISYILGDGDWYNEVFLKEDQADG
jgi:hypothetical protein